MYSACLFCHARLGANEAIEHFAVGRCLAFDGAKGRLWVICTKCGRWNLTPLEERWEAIEECERLFRGTPLRAQTKHVGFTRLREGLELVRIGRPLRPELALWRYGDALGRRRRRHIHRTAAVALATTGTVAAGIAGAVAAAGAAVWLIAITGAVAAASSPEDTVAAASFLSRSRRLARFREGGRTYLLRRRDLFSALLFHDITTREIVLELSHDGTWGGGPWFRGHSRFAGDDALRVLGKLLPQLNRAAGSDHEVRDAVGLVERAGGSAALAPLAIRDARRAGITALAYFPPAARLALEMATHEDAERRVLDGELAWLEAAWREAEEIAAIADSIPDEADPAGARGNLETEGRV